MKSKLAGSGRIRRALSALALVATFAAVSATEALGQRTRWYELYDDARGDVRAGRWAAAEQKLLAASKGGPQPGRSVLRYGTWRDDYFPDFYLALVYLNTNRPKEALARFEAARAQGLNISDGEFRVFEAQVARARTMIAEIEAATKRADATPASPPAAQPGGAPATAPNRVESPPPGPTTPAEPRTAPAPAPQQQLDQLLGTARTQLAGRNYAGALSTLAAARKLGIDAPAIAQLDHDVRRASSADQAERALQAGNFDAAEQAIVALERIDPSWPNTTALRRRFLGLKTTAQRSDGERRAMLAFFTGQYEQALTLLETVENGPGLSGRGLFYRACSLAAQALRAAPIDPERISEARRVYALSVRTGGNLSRDRRYISPEIIKALGDPRQSS